jgi:hypothetical protein
MGPLAAYHHCMSRTCPEFRDADPSDPPNDAQAFLRQAPEEEEDDEEDEDDSKQDAEDDDEGDQGYSE